MNNSAQLRFSKLQALEVFCKSVIHVHRLVQVFVKQTDQMFHSMLEIEFLVMNQFFMVLRTGRLACYLTTLNTSVSTGLLSSGFDAAAALFLVSSSWVLAAFTDLAHLSISFAIWKITDILQTTLTRQENHMPAHSTQANHHQQQQQEQQLQFGTNSLQFFTQYTSYSNDTINELITDLQYSFFSLYLFCLQ